MGVSVTLLPLLALVVALAPVFVVEDTLLGAPIGTGNLYLTNDEANGGVGVGAVTTF